MEMTADVKCYHCGHISGQMVGPRNQPLRAANFVPRQGYQGPLPRPGQRMRCERCRGPVYLEDVTPLTIGRPTVESLSPLVRRRAPGKAA